MMQQKHKITIADGEYSGGAVQVVLI